jgi:hypothetical protein
MPSEFQSMCESAQAGISVPEIPLAAIRSAADQMLAPNKRRKRVVAIVLFGLLFVGAAAAAELWDNGAHLSFGPSGRVQVSTTDEFHVIKNPTPEDLRVVARGATFPVQYPGGLPVRTTLGEIGYGHSIMLLDYNLAGAWRRPNHLLRIWLVDPRALTAPRSSHAFSFKMGGLASTGSVRWNIDREVVIVMRSLATPSEIENIKRAMVAEAKRR